MPDQVRDDGPSTVSRLPLSRFVRSSGRLIGNAGSNRRRNGLICMTQKHTSIRLATTAIAAALAISSTSVIAQEAPAPDPATAAPAPAAPDPLAPATTDTSVTPDATATPEAAPAAKRTSARTSTAAKTRPATRPAATPRAAPAHTATAAPSAQPVAPTETTAAPPVAAAPVAQPAPPAPAEPAPTSQVDMNQVLPIAGAGAAGLLALAGAGLALRRRKRRQEERYAEEQWMDNEADPMMAEPSRPPAFAAPAPAAAAIQRHDPALGSAPVTALPSGFDISRFGRNVQAAYRGPTADNPSLSLKYRLRKAAAMDQMERRADAARVEPVAEKRAANANGFILARTKPVASPAHSH